MKQVQSSESKFIHKINMILNKIKEEKSINRFVLCRLLNITPKQYELLHPYLVEAYQDKIEFNPNGKMWSWVEKDEQSEQ